MDGFTGIDSESQGFFSGLPFYLAPEYRVGSYMISEARRMTPKVAIFTMGLAF
jgi:hypothetical protein